MPLIHPIAHSMKTPRWVLSFDQKTQKKRKMKMRKQDLPL